jgi:zinc transporter
MLIPDRTYGSDEAGLVCSYTFTPGQAGRALEAEEALELAATLEASTPARRFLWLHFNLSNTAAEPWLRRNLVLPDAFYECLHSGAGTTRVEQAGDSLLAVLSDVLFEFHYDAAQVSTVFICVKPGLFVSARSKPLRSIDALRESVRKGEVFNSPAQILAHLLHLQAEVLSRIVRDSTIRADLAEDNVLASRIQSSRADLGRLRRVLVRLQRLLAPEPTALFRLLSRPPSWISKVDAQDLRHAADEFATAVADSAALVERVKLVQEELAALIGEQNNRSLFILTIVTVLAVPYNVVAGLFGMNVGGIPFAEHEAGFWLIAFLLSTLTGLAAWLLLRRR